MSNVDTIRQGDVKFNGQSFWNVNLNQVFSSSMGGGVAANGVSRTFDVDLPDVDRTYELSYSGYSQKHNHFELNGISVDTWDSRQDRLCLAASDKRWYYIQSEDWEDHEREKVTTLLLKIFWFGIVQTVLDTHRHNGDYPYDDMDTWTEPIETAIEYTTREREKLRFNQGQSKATGLVALRALPAGWHTSPLDKFDCYRCEWSETGHIQSVDRVEDEEETYPTEEERRVHKFDSLDLSFLDDWHVDIMIDFSIGRASFDLEDEWNGAIDRARNPNRRFGSSSPETVRLRVRPESVEDGIYITIKFINESFDGEDVFVIEGNEFVGPGTYEVKTTGGRVQEGFEDVYRHIEEYTTSRRDTFESYTQELASMRPDKEDHDG